MELEVLVTLPLGKVSLVAVENGKIYKSVILCVVFHLYVKFGLTLRGDWEAVLTACRGEQKHKRLEVR